MTSFRRASSAIAALGRYVPLEAVEHRPEATTRENPETLYLAAEQEAATRARDARHAALVARCSSAAEASALTWRDGLFGVAKRSLTDIAVLLHISQDQAEELVASARRSAYSLGDPPNREHGAEPVRVEVPGARPLVPQTIARVLTVEGPRA